MINVIIPSYKPDMYIYECLDSLKNQTLKKNNFFVLIILNGKRDPYFNDINKYIKEKKMDNFKILYTEHKGVSNARNIGIQNSIGEYICFIDDDDYVSKEYLEELEKASRKDAITVSNFYTVEKQKEELIIKRDYITKAYSKNSKGENSQNIIGMRKFTSSACGKLISKNIINEVKFENNLAKGEDSLFMATISKNIKAFTFAKENAIYYRRIRKNSASRVKENLITKVRHRMNLIFRYSLLLKDGKYNKSYILSRILAQIKNLAK